MEEFQKAADSSAKQLLSPSWIFAVICYRRLAERGYRTGDGILGYLSKSILVDGDTVSIAVDDDFDTHTDASPGAIGDILAEITERDVADAVRIGTRSLANSQSKLIDFVAQSFLDLLKENRSRLIKDLTSDQRKFNKHLRKDWANVLDDLNIFIWLAREIGSSTNISARESQYRHKRLLIETLTRIHAKACQTAWEIHVLLSNGLSEGAIARWRTLHELSIVGTFIQQHGRKAARLFTEHEIVGVKRRADAACDYASVLGFEPPSKMELSRVRRNFEHRKRKYGKQFLSDYGWADVLLGRNTRMSLHEMAKLLRLDHFKPWHGVANDSIHATTSGLYLRLGLHPMEEDVLLAGPSNLGLSDVVEATAHSLALLTSSVMLLDPNLDRVGATKALLAFQDQLLDATLSAEQSVLERRASMAYSLRSSRDDY